jgi:hypothetical protein
LYALLCPSHILPAVRSRPLHAPVDPSRLRWTHGRQWCSRILLDDSPRSSAHPHPPRRWRGTPEQLASQLPPHPPSRDSPTLKGAPTSGTLASLSCSRSGHGRG